MATERRKYDEEILDALAKHGEVLTILNERQQLVLKRLDAINGTVSDYNANKYKMDLACKEILENKEEHKNFIGIKLFVTISTLLGVIMVISAVLSYFGI